jgi:hypothetical protein
MITAQVSWVCHYRLGELHLPAAFSGRRWAVSAHWVLSMNDLTSESSDGSVAYERSGSVYDSVKSFNAPISAHL